MPTTLQLIRRNLWRINLLVSDARESFALRRFGVTTERMQVLQDLCRECSS